MGGRFFLRHQNIDGNLYVQPIGDLDGSTACELVHFLRAKYNGEGRVIIDTGKLCTICPFGRGTFQCRLAQSQLPLKALLFAGKKGDVLAPEGCRVVNYRNAKGFGRRKREKGDVSKKRKKD